MRQVHRAVIAVRQTVVVIAVLFLASCAYSQCPDTGQTKVIKPNKGSGYYFFRFMGDSSFRYFLDGKTFRFDDTADPGRTFILIDNMSYESILVSNADLAEYVRSPKPVDVLRDQAKHHQEYFKKVDPSMVITDFGPSSSDNSDGSDDRLFYLWKKESAAGKKAATQYLCSTVIKNGVVVLSVMLLEPSVSEEDVFRQIREYTSRFDSPLSAGKCAQVLSAPTAP